MKSQDAHSSAVNSLRAQISLTRSAIASSSRCLPSELEALLLLEKASHVLTITRHGAQVWSNRSTWRSILLHATHILTSADGKSRNLALYCSRALLLLERQSRQTMAQCTSASHADGGVTLPKNNAESAALRSLISPMTVAACMGNGLVAKVAKCRAARRAASACFCRAL